MFCLSPSAFRFSNSRPRFTFLKLVNLHEQGRQAYSSSSSPSGLVRPRAEAAQKLASIEVLLNIVIPHLCTPRSPHWSLVDPHRLSSQLYAVATKVSCLRSSRLCSSNLSFVSLFADRLHQSLLSTTLAQSAHCLGETDRNIPSCVWESASELKLTKLESSLN